MNTIVGKLVVAGKIAMLAASLSIVAPAHGAIIVDHGNGGSLNGSSWTNDKTHYSVWDDFQLDNSAKLTGISYFTNNTYAPGMSDYTLRIGSAAGKTDVLDLLIPKSATTMTTVTGGARVDAQFSAVNLSAGTYWLSFTNPGGLHGSASVAGGSLIQMYGTTSYLRHGDASSFLLAGETTAVPEPGSVALLGLGLIGFIAARRKARK